MEELEFVLFPRTDAKKSSNSTLVFRKMGATPTLVFKNQDGIKMIAKMVERLLLGLHIKIKSVIIVFEHATYTCSTNLGFESSCQCQSFLSLQVLQTENGTNVSGDACESVGLHLDSR